MNNPQSQRLKIGLRGPKVLAWVGVIFFFGCSLGAYFDRQYGPSAFFWVFILTGVYMLISAGGYEIDEEGVSHKSSLGHYRILWREARRIDFGTNGAIVLHGEDKRFVMYPPTAWSGPDKPHAVELFERKIKELGLTPNRSIAADYKIHKNVKVRDTAT